jgi:6-phosphogluconolactonase
MGDDLHRLEIESQSGWAVRAADVFEIAIESAIAQRERCLIALSGGETPGPAMAELAARPIEWDRVVMFQVDERLAPAGSDDRNLRAQQEAFASLPITWIPLPADRVVAAGLDPGRLDDAIADFSWRLIELADDPPVLDVVQLGLGVNGHTASLLPGDAAVDELRRYVALSGAYKGYRRLTLTRPVLDRAQLVVWLVRGAEKAEPLGRLLAGDLSIPAGLIRPRQSIVIADADAARQF